jgi:radical SAM superfamily enzyme YgiQ (UPF0313 family)
VISDFVKGALQKEYRGGLSDLKNLPVPRHDLFHPDYWFASVYTTRGCPSNCSFCSVTAFNGSKHRFRPVEEVLDEIATIQKKLIFFVDDNITGYGREARNHALSIFRGMVDRKLDKIWFSQAALNFGDDEELLKAASDSGCRMILIGIESEKQEQLASAKKHFNVKRLDRYEETFRNIHRYQIAILGTFMFGMDGDDVKALHDRSRYIMRSSIDAYQTTIMTPLPGTALYRQLEETGRLTINKFPEGWNQFQFFNFVFKPTHATADELFQTMVEIWKRIYSKQSIRLKAFKTFWQLRSWNLHRWFTRGWEATLWSFHTNWLYRNLTLGKSKENIVNGGIREQSVKNNFNQDPSQGN